MEGPVDGSSLFHDVLGSELDALAPGVPRLHRPGCRVFTGVFRVRRGRRFVTRALAAVLRLPSPGHEVQVELVVEPRGDGEAWHRCFAGRRFSTRLAAGPEATVRERWGAIEVLLELSVFDGGLVYRGRRARLRLGRLSVPLPGFLGPAVDAEERPAPLPDLASIRVEIRAGRLGPVLEYEGRLAERPGPPGPESTR